MNTITRRTEANMRSKDGTSLPWDYYRRNRVADLIVMILHGSRFYEDGVGFRRFDFEDFVEELNRHGIYYRGEHFEEVMYEVVNRKMLRDKFNDYLKRKLNEQILGLQR